MHPMLNIAMSAARECGKIMLRSYDDLASRSDSLDKKRKSVDDVDLGIEKMLVESIQAKHPDHNFITKNQGHIAGSFKDYTWIIDGLNGRDNFHRTLPGFGLSIAMIHKGQLEISVIYDPLVNDMFAASRGEGAQLNDRKIRVGQLKELDQAIFGLSERTPTPDNFASRRLIHNGALTLGYCAAGRIDVAQLHEQKPWDVAAGILLVREAGGIALDNEGNQDCIQSSQVAAGNLELVKQLT